MRFLPLALVLLITPGTALSQNLGVNLHWSDCTLGSPSMDLVGDCLDAGAPHKLVISVGGSGVVEDVIGAECVIDILVDGPQLPDFWRMEAGGCRQGTLAADLTIGSTSPPYSCPEPWSITNGGPGGQAGGVIFEPFINGPNRGRITCLIAVQGTATIDLDNVAPDWYIMGVNMLKSGSASCAGCTTPTCLVAQQVRLYKPAGTPGGDLFVASAAVNNVVTWRGGGGGVSCFTPTKSHSWGEVKSLYR